MSNKFLTTKAFNPLAPGRIRPKGWLEAQLRIQANSLTGHLDEFWPDVADSQWIGGSTEGWERGPYWLDGLVPLAYLLDDAQLKAKVKHWIDQILAQQHEDGWIGPVHDTRYGYPHDPWPLYIVFKAFTQYQEATQDPRIIPAMQRFFRRLDHYLSNEHLRSWARYRWADMVLSIHWLYERTQEPWLLEVATKLKAQGYDWRQHYETFPYWYKSRREECDLRTHVVNNAMALKTPGVWSRQSQDLNDQNAFQTILEALDTYHGQANGMFSGDEHLAGLDPSQGTELCAVVEFMYSLEVLMAILGRADLGDHLELATFNALPATMSPDMWSHQYDQQVNQVLCRIDEDQPWTTNGPDANIFGLAPNYGCCTANLHQGWPKFATHLVMETPDPGLAITAYAPCTIQTNINEQPVRIEMDTNYPFNETIHLSVHVQETVGFPILLRIPGWAHGATIQDASGHTTPLEPGGFHRVDQHWQGTHALTLHFPMTPRIKRGYRNSISIYRGPLLYALKMGEEWRQIAGEKPHCDWEVYPTTPWNYALMLNPDNPEGTFQFQQGNLAQNVFSPETAPILTQVKAKRIPTWDLHRNAAGPIPESPANSDGVEETVTLIPYGCTNLRIAAFPVLETSE